MRVKEILGSFEKEEQLSLLLQSIPKKNRKTQVEILYVWSRLAYLFYLSGDEGLARKITDKLLQLDFTGDYRYWEPVQNAALLAAYMDEKQAGWVKERLEAARNFGDEDLVFGKKKVHQRFLRGIRLESLQAEAEAAESQASKMNKNIILLSHLFYLRSFADESDLDIKMIEQRIAKTVTLLSAYIGQEGIRQLSPFK